MRQKSWLAGLPMLAALLGSEHANAIDPFFPEFGNEGYDVRDYNLTLDVGPAANRLTGFAAISVVATARLSRVVFDLAGLNVRSVRVNGAVAGFDHDGAKLRIRLPAPIAAGGAFDIAVSYAGSPEPVEDPTAPGLDILGLGWIGFDRNTYVVSEPVGAANWFPVNDVPTDKATYRFSVTVPKPYTAVASGILVSTTDLGQDRRFVWRQQQPMASYLAIVDVARYRTQITRARNNLPLRFYTTPATPPETLASFSRTADMLAYFERFAGPYPFNSYGSVIVDDPELYYALETQAMSTFPSAYRIGESTVAHELAHQWFGNAVTVERWADLWLAEGFATYFEYIWEFRSDRAGLDAAFRELYDCTLADGVGPAVVSQPEDIFSASTYDRGALTLQALRLRVGDAVFFRTLKAFYQTYRYRNAGSQDFIDVAVRQSGQPAVRTMLNAWLYEAPLPPLGSYRGGECGDGAAAAKVAASAHDITRRYHAPRNASRN